jgi:hypothetical protein
VRSSRTRAGTLNFRAKAVSASDINTGGKIHEPQFVLFMTAP